MRLSAADLVNDLPQASVNAFVAESVMLAVMQDRLSSIPALDLATVLAGRTELKVSLSVLTHGNTSADISVSGHYYPSKSADHHG